MTKKYDPVAEAQLRMTRYTIEHHEKWREWIGRIPWIQFPTDWLVQVIPPFGGAIARFRVKLPSGSEKSIYLDAFGALGYYSKPDTPYWEVYPVNGDTGRCDMDDIPELLRLIAEPA